ncbi:hypothetical protein ACWC10_30550 [Streptomyces sp. NPDC001595]|uniref:hypothetical protein n=1 Tax=Streptomyces sp. NPDC001532 TaxID=3154520 RepID=UPI0033167487
MTQTPTRPSRTFAHRRAATAIGVVGLLASAWLLLFPMRGALDDARAFRAAEACAPGERGDDCLRTAAARIEGIDEVSGRRSASYWLYLDEADGTHSRTRLPGVPGENPAARAGQRVDVTYWRDQIRYVGFPDGRRFTTADPRDDWRPYCAWGLGLGLYTAGTAATVAWWSRRARTARRAYSWQLGAPLVGVCVLTAVGALAPGGTDRPAAAFRAVGVALPVVAAGSWAGVLLARRRERGDDTVAVTASVPTTDRVFPGALVGEVPYARGGGFLVAGPSGLAETPDPSGVSYRRPAPATLTPVRVRPPYRTDPEFPYYGGRALVLECRDEGVPVLVVTHHKQMRWVLGALRQPGGGLRG